MFLNEVIYIIEVNDFYGDLVCCILFYIYLQIFNFNVINDFLGLSLYYVVIICIVRFRYEDFNFYMIYMCCDDIQN